MSRENGATRHTDGEEPELSRAKRVAFWAITLLAPPLLLLGLLELGLRLASPERAPLARAELDQRLQESERTEVRVVTTGNLRGLIQPSERPGVIYELKPSRRWVFLGATTETNSLGLRGPERSLSKPSGVLRIAGLGDSVMFGWGVGQQEIYTSRLEGALREHGRRAEVLNFAVPGYNSAQEAALLPRVLEFQPDLLLLNYCDNDWVAPFFVVDPNLHSIIESSLLMQNIRERIVPGVDEGFFEAYQGMDKVRTALGRIAVSARAAGIPVLFFVYPHPARPGAAQAMESLARENGFGYVDMFEPFQAYLRERGLPDMEALDVAPGDTHPNSEAHALMARVLATRIEAMRPLGATVAPEAAPTPGG